ncbi:nucleotidyltransferase family protein [Sulfurospirillum multivorans]|uniref:NTP-binding protein n=2 Tax=Sulfurospirillum multivorans TaxID=66821 RepID=A0AA86APF8_SULMK|nr:nucleotidyltransferase domain-containing protein [Sulfurospirillum multivorans]AHJ13372.1 NTP-binding protein [Sulfurospirillum multivorans DSM 12446]QEH06863.1 NTP-binding protein [Sulfurospirillum multivorans]
MCRKSLHVIHKALNLRYNFFMKKETILQQLKSMKNNYLPEGFVIEGLFGSYARDEADETSDIDILIEAKPSFVERYGIKSIERIEEIKKEMSSVFGISVDLADKTGMGKTAQKFIIDRTIYV